MINLVSRNLPFWRHISERNDLGGSQTSIVSTDVLHTILLHCSKSVDIQYNSFKGPEFSHIPVAKTVCHDDRRSVPLDGGNHNCCRAGHYCD